MTDLAKEIVNGLIKDKQAFEHLKRSIAWRMKDAEIVDIHEVAEIKEEVMVLQRQVDSLEKGLIDMIRPIIIEQLPKCMDLFFAEEK